MRTYVGFSFFVWEYENTLLVLTTLVWEYENGASVLATSVREYENRVYVLVISVYNIYEDASQLLHNPCSTKLFHKIHLFDKKLTNTCRENSFFSFKFGIIGVGSDESSNRASWTSTNTKKCDACWLLWLESLYRRSPCLEGRTYYYFFQLQIIVARIIATITNWYGSHSGAILIIKGEWVIYDQPNSHYQRWTSYPRTAHPIYVFQ